MKYEDYLKTPWWRARRVRYFAHHDEVCASCGADEQIHLHHHTYERFGAELDGDLLPLCATCHRLVHRHHRQARGSLTVATFEVVALLSGREAAPTHEAVGHVPLRHRDASVDIEGRTVVKGEWRDETRTPSWIKPLSG